ARRGGGGATDRVERRAPARLDRHGGGSRARPLVARHRGAEQLRARRRHVRAARAPCAQRRARGGAPPPGPRPPARAPPRRRSHASRGADAARELVTALAQLSADLSQLEGQVAQAQGVVAEVTQDSARAAGAASDAESALVDIGERVKRATGSDPETVRAIAE